jgi:GH15 family glucan-1,4-alpha-glucosidase
MPRPGYTERPPAGTLCLTMSYKPIESYGVIGDMHSVALVGTDGSIDWCCLPNFDSPSVFAALLDDEKGGSFKLAATADCTLKQMYLPDTNVLLTRFLGADGVGEVCDFMPIHRDDRGAYKRGRHQIVRVARAVRGEVEFRLDCRPAIDFARRPHRIVLDPRGAIFDSDGLDLGLLSPLPLVAEGDGVSVTFVLKPGESATFALRQVEDWTTAEDLLADRPTAGRPTSEPWSSGDDGAPARATTAAGARRCSGRRSRSSC